MQYWLMKSEPAKYGWDDLVRDGRTVWDGVRNHQVAIWLRSMKTGDRALFYHSVEELAAVGIMEVVDEAHPDASDPTGRFVAVDVAPVKSLATPVTLAAMKAEPKLADLPLFRQFRLSIVPLTDVEWATVMRMAGEASATAT
ncbi:MAG: EVE domain-containing protein [Sphingomonadaceae bacterium]|nr:EVE domain-containing protein [Sphingomonadaceae bacterium]